MESGSINQLSSQFEIECFFIPQNDWTVEEFPAISKPWTANDLSARVNILQKLAVQLRSKRVERGALRLDKPKLTFTLNAAKEPQGYRPYEHRHSNKLIEEFMLLANMSVAKKIHSAYPELAVLRNHPEPKETMLLKLLQSLKAHGVDMDFSTSKALALSLKNFEPKDENDQQQKAKYVALVNMCSKPMELARYLVSGDGAPNEFYRHYALSVDLYTHFTSPIRRYCDVLVHRLLQAALLQEKTVKDVIRADLVRKVEACNDKRLAAKTAGEKSEELFLALFVKKCGPLNEKGVVVNVGDKGVDVLIIEMATIKRAYLDKIDPDSLREPPKFCKKDGKPEVELMWKGEKEDTKRTLRMFTQVSVTLQANEDSDKNDFLVIIKKDDN